MRSVLSFVLSMTVSWQVLAQGVIRGGYLPMNRDNYMDNRYRPGTLPQYIRLETGGSHFYECECEDSSSIYTVGNNPKLLITAEQESIAYFTADRACQNYFPHSYSNMAVRCIELFQ